MNAFSSVWSDTQILQIIIQEELEKLIHILQRDSKKRFQLALAFLVMKIRKNIQSMYQKNVAKKNVLTFY